MIRKALPIFLINLGSSFAFSKSVTAADAVASVAPRAVFESIIKYKLVSDCISDKPYFIDFDFYEELESHCKRAGRLVVQELDFIKAIPVVVFSTDLKKNMNSAEELAFLKDLRREVQLAKSYRYKINIFDLFVKLSKNREEAILRVGVYLQNTSIFRGHLDSKYFSTKIQQEALAVLNDTLQIIMSNRNLFEVESNGFRIPFEKLYHFFVPAELAQRLKERGLPEALATYMAFDFNWNYEVLDSSAFVFQDLYLRTYGFNESNAQDALSAFAGPLMVFGKALNHEEINRFNLRLTESANWGRHDILMSLKKFF